MSIEKLTLLTDPDGAALLEARLGADAIDPPLAVSRFLAGKAWQVDALFEAPFDRGRLLALVDGVKLAAEPRIDPIADQNWVAHVERTLKPISAGPFLVHGPHDRAAAVGHPYAIEIEAGGAFGTAHHATTQGCLAAIGEVLSQAQAKWLPGSPESMRPSQETEQAQARRGDGRPKRILDLGTGSGILAIAAAKLSPDAAILATDIDPDSVRIAGENAAINGVAARIRCITAEGLTHPELSRAANFDVILANILAEPLVSLAPGLRRALADGGCIVLSGLLAEQQRSVLGAYEREGLRLVAEWPIEGWVTMRVG